MDTPITLKPAKLAESLPATLRPFRSVSAPFPEWTSCWQRCF
jgi:hypothetical protein